ncbi:hypothetical protein MMPV_000693 [Pyropia vietnamensis]
MVSLLRSSFRGAAPPPPQPPPARALSAPVRALAASLHSLGPRGGLEYELDADSPSSSGGAGSSGDVLTTKSVAKATGTVRGAGGISHSASVATMVGGSASMGAVGGRPPSPPRNFHSLIARDGLRLLITRVPTTAELPGFPAALAASGVSDLVVVTERTFPAGPLESAGITVTDLPWENGLPPPPRVVAAWLSLIDNAKGVVACACMGGLGRAPTLVAAALVERGVSVAEAVGVVRARRRGAINGVQMGWLWAYVPGKATAVQGSAAKRGGGKAADATGGRGGRVGGFARRGSSSGLLRLRRWSGESVDG